MTCLRTGNPVGTDTVPRGQVCPCPVCRLTRERDALRDGMSYAYARFKQALPTYEAALQDERGERRESALTTTLVAIDMLIAERDDARHEIKQAREALLDFAMIRPGISEDSSLDDLVGSVLLRVCEAERCDMDGTDPRVLWHALTRERDEALARVADLKARVAYLNECEQMTHEANDRLRTLLRKVHGGDTHAAVSTLLVRIPRATWDEIVEELEGCDG